LSAEPESVAAELVVPRSATSKARGGWLSRYARRRKLEFFFPRIPPDARILDVGCASGWVEAWAEPRGWHGIVGIDRRPPADVVGDVNDWKALGLEPHSFDVIVAFEVVEHGDIGNALLDLLKPDGMLMATTPVPRMDWCCKLLEGAHLLQRRTGPHTDLVDLRAYPGFSVVERRVKGVIAQWAVLQPTLTVQPRPDEATSFEAQ
jgi:2-polyprenyl-3-methyl-5-hydroxy-6-metoxy-1,4-benzoquinol methylase